MSNEIENGLDKDDRQNISMELEKILANIYVIYFKTLKLHWNVKSQNFKALHDLTEAQYLELSEAGDEVAERIRALGFYPPASMAKFIDLSDIDESDDNDTTSKMLEALIKDNEVIAKQLRNTIKIADELTDVGTSDLLTSRIKSHEKNAWMLRSSQ